MKNKIVKYINQNTVKMYNDAAFAFENCLIYRATKRFI